MKPPSIFSRFRFTLAEAFGVIAVVAVCAGAFANDSHYAELALHYFALTLVLVAALLVLFSGPLRRPFATAFAAGTVLHWFSGVSGRRVPAAAEAILLFVQGGQPSFPQMDMLHTFLSLAFGALAGAIARMLVKCQNPPA